MRKKEKPTGHKIPERIERDLAFNMPTPKDEPFTSMFHAVNPGDLAAAMGAMKRYYDSTKRKVKVLQSVSTRAQYYPGAVHPTLDSSGNNVCCNDYMWEMLKPLVESQYYIHSFEKYQGQPFDVDLNVIRGKTDVNLPQGPIQGWLPIAYPDLHFDMSKPWIFIEGECPKYIKSQVKGKIILNFTERYRNPSVEYFFLKNYSADLIFAGTEREHWLFCNQWQLDIPLLKVNNFLDLGFAIRESRFILGNQSFCINLAYGMGRPRIIELCKYAQNVIHMVGDHCYGFMYQVGVEYYFRGLFAKFKR